MKNSKVRIISSPSFSITRNDFMFNISIWLSSPYTPSSSQDYNDISWLLASWLALAGSNLISTSSDLTSNTTWSTGHQNVWLFILAFRSIEPINNFTVRTKPFLPGKVLITFASFHSFRLQLSSFKMTMSCCRKVLLVNDNFCHSWNDNKNSLCHQLQNLLLQCRTLLYRFLQ